MGANGSLKGGEVEGRRGPRVTAGSKACALISELASAMPTWSLGCVCVVVGGFEARREAQDFAKGVG